MKIAIISDTHDNAPNLEKALGWMKKNKIEQIIFCGDLCALSVLSEILAPNFSGKIHMVFGNVEDREFLPELVKKFKHINHYGDQGEVNLDNKKVAFTHFIKDAKKLAESNKYDYIFYGHEHKPWEQKIGNTKLVNPGTLAGLFNKATFAVWDTETDGLELKLVEKL